MLSSYLEWLSPSKEGQPVVGPVLVRQKEGGAFGFNEKGKNDRHHISSQGVDCNLLHYTVIFHIMENEARLPWRCDGGGDSHAENFVVGGNPEPTETRDMATTFHL